MGPSSSGLIAELVGKFLVDFTYYESPSPSQKLSTDVTSLSELAVDMVVADGTSVSCAWFEFILPLSVAAVVAVLEATVLVRVWAAWAAPALAVKAGHSVPSVITVGDNARDFG